MSQRFNGNGTVLWYDTKLGYGFIKANGEILAFAEEQGHPIEDGNGIFVHWKFIQGEGFKCLQEGQTVEFNLVWDEKAKEGEGSWQAHDVVILDQEELPVVETPDPVRMTGKVISYDMGYGFIEPDERNAPCFSTHPLPESEGIFVHQSFIKKDGFRHLDEEDAVAFDLVWDKKRSKWQAHNVVVLTTSVPEVNNDNPDDGKDTVEKEILPPSPKSNHRPRRRSRSAIQLPGTFSGTLVRIERERGYVTLDDPEQVETAMRFIHCEGELLDGEQKEASIPSWRMQKNWMPGTRLQFELHWTKHGLQAGNLKSNGVTTMGAAFAAATPAS